MNQTLGILVVASIITMSSCSSRNDETTAEPLLSEAVQANEYKLTQIQFSFSNMELGKLVTKPFHEIVKATGIFDVPPENRVTVSTYFGGAVTHIDLLPGVQVKKGQTLFSLENPDFVQIQQDYLEAKGQLAYLKSDFERQKNLVKDNVTSEKNFLKAESDYTVTRVKLESLGKKLSLMGIDPKNLTLENIRSSINISSPINGFVTQVNIARGAFLAPSQTAITIVDTDHLHLELNIFEKDLPKVKVGQSIKFNLQEDYSTIYDATVHLVNKTVDPESRTVGIHGHLSNESLSSKFNPGMYVEANILTTSQTKTALPQEALVEVDGKYFVLVLSASSDEGFTFLKKEIKIGSSNKGYVEILNSNDLKDNSEFLVKGAFNLIKE
ncbi:MAG: efflux RND transporter periplasmic adaptor subunit [Saprospiraceae bacterium]|nr:efflux RND transporter periplasmic adaptor subunit [Saprospiraceae bacterium]